MSKKKNLITLLAVLAVLAAAYFGVTAYSDYASQKKEEKAQAESEENRIWITDLDEVKEISYDNGNEKLTFIKEDEEWKYQEAEDFPLEQSYLTALEETVSHLEATRKLEGGDELEAYGLEEPQATVEVTDEEGNKTILNIGNSVESEYYLLKEGEEIPYTIGSSLYNEIQNDLYDMIQIEEIPDVTEENILSVEIKNETDHYLLEKTEITSASSADATQENAEDEMEKEYEWYLKEDDKKTKISNESLCDTLLSNLYGLSFESCENYKGDETQLKEAGLDEEKISFTVKYEEEDGKQAEYTVIVGKKKTSEGDGTSGYYGRLSTSKAINILNETVVENITGHKVNEFLNSTEK